MPLRETLLLAWEALIANKLRAGLTMLGMIIGVGAVVLLVSIGNGAKNYITSQFEGLGTNLVMVQPGRTDKRRGFGPPIGGAKEKLTLEDIDALQRRAVNLEAVTGLVFGAAQFKTIEATSNANVLGVNEAFTRIFNVGLAKGEFFTQEEDYGRRVVVLGHEVARTLFPNQDPLGQLLKINGSEHRVIGVTAKSGNTLGFNFDDIALVPTRAGMRLFNDDKLFGIRAKARSRSSVDDAVAEITEILKERHNGEEDFTVTTQYSTLQTMNTILGMLTYVLAGIAMISMLVGGIGIMNIMLVSVTERTREIGIRRAVGARRSDILRQFLVEALALSLMGGMTGLLGSVFITYAVTWLAGSFDMRPPAWILVPAFGLSLLTGVVFGVWPARKASRIETIEALRYE